MSLASYRTLKLLAHDAADLEVISACLQDAVAKLGDFAYLPDARRFAFVVNRFVWECASDRRKGVFARVRAGAHFDDVMKVERINLRAEAPEAIVELLAVRFEPSEDGAGLITLDFSGGGAIRLYVEAINAGMADLSAPWSTRNRPAHEI